MRKWTVVGATLFISLLLNPAMGADKYVGSEICSRCHMDQYNDFRSSGHPFKLTRAEDARKRPIPLPKGYRWNDISYVIGGFHKKIRFVGKKGYIITAGKDGSDLKTQFNLETGKWAYYHKGEKKPYTCGRCHTTGYTKSGNQDGLPGIKGSWAFPGVQCEACHGPGKSHARSGDKTKIKIDRSSASCGKCHSRGATNTIPAKKGYIRHHEQINEMLAAGHAKLDCVSCHSPHKTARFSIRTNCKTCHATQVKEYLGSTMQRVGVTCVDCHMPKATKSATARNKFEGDIRTHIFRINTGRDANMFFEEEVKGKTRTFARGFVTVDFACLNCHGNQNKGWAATNARRVHRRGK